MSERGHIHLGGILLGLLIFYELRVIYPLIQDDVSDAVRLASSAHLVLPQGSYNPMPIVARMLPTRRQAVSIPDYIYPRSNSDDLRAALDGLRSHSIPVPDDPEAAGLGAAASDARGLLQEKAALQGRVVELETRLAFLEKQHGQQRARLRSEKERLKKTCYVPAF